MPEDNFDEPLAQSPPAKLFQHKYVRDPRERRVVCNHAREPDLLSLALIDAEGQRVLDGAAHDFE
jgi:hypothetical protein